MLRRAAPSRVCAALTLSTLASIAAAQELGDPSRTVPARGFSDRTPNVDVRVTDLDGDGRADLVVLENGLHVHYGTANGSFEPGFLPLNLTSSIVAFEATDLDDDGDADLALVSGGQLFVLRNLQARSFALEVPTAPLLAGPSSENAQAQLLAVELDGLRAVDLVAVFDQGAGGLHLLLNQGDGDTFTDGGGGLPVGVDDARAACAGDLDGDARMDLVLGRADDSVSVLLNAGAGTFVLAPGTFPTNPTMVGADLGDLDGDGNLDLLVGTDPSMSLESDEVHFGDGAGGFVPSTSVLPTKPARTPTSSPRFVDLDGDGDLDVLLPEGDGFQLSTATALTVLENVGSGQLEDRTGVWSPAGAFVGPSDVGDLDGDGDPDVVTVRGDARPGVFRNDGEGALDEDPRTTPLPPVVVPGDLVTDSEAFDANADGLPDLALALSGGLTLWLSDGHGGYADGSAPFAGRTASALASGDLDGDGDLDLVAIAGGLDVYVNAGAGDLTLEPGRVVGVVGSATSLGLGDLDGDGALDALVGTQAPLASASFYGDGGGVLVEDSSGLPPNLSSIVHQSLADFDRDGDLDLIAENSVGPGEVYWRNQGARTFLDDSASLPPTPSLLLGLEPSVGDVDEDGDLDLAFGQGVLWTNDGSGGFVDATSQLDSFDGQPVQVLLVDLDEDGDLDLLSTELVLVGTTSSGAPSSNVALTVQENDGTGTFTRSGLERIEVPFGCTTTFDADGDGDADALAGDFLLRNLRRQLSRNGHARLGGAFALDVHAPFGGPYALAVATSPLDVALGSLGTLRVDLTTSVFLTTGLVPAGRPATTSFDVPADVSLLGAEFFGQALVSFPDRLTNLEAVTISGS